MIRARFLSLAGLIALQGFAPETLLPVVAGDHAIRDGHNLLQETQTDAGVIRYRGAIDDNRYENRVKHRYLADAVKQVVSGQDVTTSTAKPNSKWVAQQARNFLTQVANRDDRPEYLLRDRDSKFTRQFDEILKAGSVKPKMLPFRSPNLNARCERVIQTIQQECLDNFLVFGTRHFDYLVSKFAEYYNTESSHSRREHLPPLRRDLPEENSTIDFSKFVCKERLGGLIKSFERAAA